MMTLRKLAEALLNAQKHSCRQYAGGPTADETSAGTWHDVMLAMSLTHQYCMKLTPVINCQYAGCAWM